MASSPTPEDAYDTPAPPIITPLGNSRQPTLRNLQLNHTWMIGEPMTRKNGRHAAIYSVLLSETGQEAEDLEAHVFLLDGIDKKLRKHRQRCIKRMEGRTKMKLEIDKITIFVIAKSQKKNSSVLAHGAVSHSQDKDGQHERDIGVASIGKAKRKTLYQLELQRIRQRERRQAKRRAKTGEGDGRTVDGGHNITEIDQDSLFDGKNEFFIFVSLIHELLDGSDLGQEIPAIYTSLTGNVEDGCPNGVFDQYLIQTADAIETVESLASYLGLKRSEVISLWRHRVLSSPEMYLIN